MDDFEVTKLVIALYTASGHDYGDTTEAVYREALRDVPNDVGALAAADLIRYVSWDHRPSPALVLEKVNAIMTRRREDTPAIPESTRECTPEESRANIQKIREMYAEALAKRPPRRERRPRMTDQEGDER